LQGYGRRKKETDAKKILFKSLYGIKPGTFEKMLPILQRDTMPYMEKAANRQN
jgi:hypothetical protein